jgi:hypothetical protein
MLPVIMLWDQQTSRGQWQAEYTYCGCRESGGGAGRRMVAGGGGCVADLETVTRLVSLGPGALEVVAVSVDSVWF